MSLNLRRETRCFISTVESGFSNTNTFEVPVLSDYSFSQGTGSETITLNEAGASPKRGQRSFNISLEQVELTLPTYIRPYISGTHNCVENILWEGITGAAVAINTNAKPGPLFFQADFENSNVHELKKLVVFLVMENSAYKITEAVVNSAEVDFNIDAIGMITWNLLGKDITTYPTIASPTLYPDPDTPGTTFLQVPAAANFIKNKLSTIELSKLSGTTSAYWTVDYGNALDLTALTGMSDATAYTAAIAVDGGTQQTISIDPANIGGAATATVADFLTEMNNQIEGAIIYEKAGDLVFESVKSGSTTNMLVADGGVNTLLALLDGVNFAGIGSVTAGTGTAKSYDVPVTGGSLTIENNVTFLTPEELGKINSSIGHFTGTRAVSGSLTCYLNTGSNNSEGLFDDLASDTATVTHEFEMTLQLGGPVSPRVEFIMNHASLTIPSIQSEDVISLSVDFTALGNSITDKDEVVVRYYAV